MGYTGRSERSHRFYPRHPEKYVGDPKNIISRSSLETTFMEHCDTDPNIIRWASEEIIVPYFYPTDGRWHRYFPDFIIQVRTTTNHIKVYMVEIKPYKQTQVPIQRPKKKQRTYLREMLDYTKNSAKWEAASAFCREKGWEFKVVTERDLYPSLSPK